MSAQSSIEWTDRTWNPTRGCSVISPGCVNCYAMKFAHRFSGPGKPYEGLTKMTKAGPQWTGNVRPVGDALREPLSWRKPARVFVDSMSDLFHEDVDPLFIGRVFNVMAQARRHTFQILTKRSERMLQIVSALAPFHTAPDGSGWPLPNVWLGVSVEDQPRADQRIPLLLQTPAAVRFVSAEPLIGPIDFAELPSHYDAGDGEGYCYRPLLRLNALRGGHRIGPASFGPKTHRLDWVIVGGESGPGWRGVPLVAIADIVQQCKVAGVACFVKQLGSQWRGVSMLRDGVVVKAVDSKGGDPDEWPDYLRVRDFPNVAA